MTGPDKHLDSDAMSGQDVFMEVSNLSKKWITDILLRMIEGAEDYHSWSLSDKDGARVVKLIRHKQRIICSSFTFQLNKHFFGIQVQQLPGGRKRGSRLANAGTLEQQ